MDKSENYDWEYDPNRWRTAGTAMSIFGGSYHGKFRINSTLDNS